MRPLGRQARPSARLIAVGSTNCTKSSQLASNLRSQPRARPLGGHKTQKKQQIRMKNKPMGTKKKQIKTKNQLMGTKKKQVKAENDPMGTSASSRNILLGFGLGGERERGEGTS